MDSEGRWLSEDATDTTDADGFRSPERVRVLWSRRGLTGSNCGQCPGSWRSLWLDRPGVTQAFGWTLKANYLTILSWLWSAPPRAALNHLMSSLSSLVSSHTSISLLGFVLLLLFVCFFGGGGGERKRGLSTACLASPPTHPPHPPPHPRLSVCLSLSLSLSLNLSLLFLGPALSYFFFILYTSSRSSSSSQPPSF